MKRGRPPLPKGESKSARFNLRLTDDEVRRLALEAGKAGVDLSEYVRSKLTPKQSQPKPDGMAVLDWNADEGRILFVTPAGLTMQHWEQLRKYIDVIKPRTTPPGGKHQ